VVLQDLLDGDAGLDVAVEHQADQVDAVWSVSACNVLPRLPRGLGIYICRTFRISVLPSLMAYSIQTTHMDTRGLQSLL
jgi:hypothetical protein